MYVEFGYKENDRWNRNIFIREEQIEEYREKHGNKDVFTTYFKYPNQSKPNQDTEIVGDMVFDFDSKKDVEEARDDALGVIGNMSREFGVDTGMVNITFSGMKGYHINIPYQLFDAKADKRMEKIYRRIASVYFSGGYKTIDMSMYQKNRFLRLPNSRHGDTGFYAIPLTFNELRNMDTDRIINMALKPRKIIYKQFRMSGRAKTLYDVNEERIGKPIKILSNDNSNGNGKDKYFQEHIKIRDFPPCIQGIIEEGMMTGECDHEQRLFLSMFLVKVWDINRINRFFSKMFGDYNEGYTLYQLKFLLHKNYKVYGCDRIKDMVCCKYIMNMQSCPFFPSLNFVV